MKKHFLLLALAAICSLSIMGEPIVAEWGFVQSGWNAGEYKLHFPNSTTSSDNSITIQTYTNVTSAWWCDALVEGIAIINPNTPATDKLDISLDDGLEICKIYSANCGGNCLKIIFSSEVPFDASQTVGEEVLVGHATSARQVISELDLEDKGYIGARSARILPHTYIANQVLYYLKVEAKSAAPAGPTHKVKYEAGDATGTAPASKDVEESKTYKLAEPTSLTYAGHIFTGWKSSADDQVYAAGTQMAMGTADVTYTAQWKVGAIAHWRLNESGIALPGTAGATQNGITLMPSNDPIPNGNVFGNGWSWRTYRFNPNVEGANAYVALSTIAEQQLAEVTVSIRNNSSTQGFYIEFYDEEGGELLGTSSLTGTKTPATEQPCTISSIPEDSHYAIIKTSAGDNENYLYDIQVTTTEAPVVTKYTVSFAAGGATGTVPADMKKAENKTYTLPQPTGLTYTKHTFAGWKSGADDQVYAAGTQMTMGTADVTYTAQWVIGTKALWGDNCDAPLPSNASSTVNSIALSTSLSAATAWLDNRNQSAYNFQDFTTSSYLYFGISADDLELAEIDAYDYFRNATYLLVQFATTSTYDEDAKLGEPLALSNGSSAIPAPTGAKSAKIYASATGWGPFVTQLGAKTRECTVVYHTISFLAGEAQGTAPKEKVLGEDFAYTLPEPTGLTYTGHIFAGWKSSADNNIYPAGTQMTMGTAGVTYTAQWEVGYIAEWGEYQNNTPINRFNTTTYINNVKINAYNGEAYGGIKVANNVNGWAIPQTVSAYKTQGSPTYMDIELSEDIFSTMEISELTYSIGYLGGPKLHITYASSQHFDADAALGSAIELTNGNAQGEDQEFYTLSIPSGVRSARITSQNNATGETYLYYLKVKVTELSLPSFNVTYDAGGATGTAPADDKAYEGSPYTLAEPTSLEKTGFVFTGWKSSIDDEVYAAGTSLQITDDVTFTAQWEVKLVDPTITFRDSIYIVDESTLDLSKLFKSNSTGAVTYSVKDAGITGAAISGSTFTATATGTAIVTASQARVEGAYNAKSVNATITVKAYAKNADFYAEANSGSPTDMNTFLLQKHYTIVAPDPKSPYWDEQQHELDGGLAITGESTTSFWVKANQKVTIKVGRLNGDQTPKEATLTMNGGTPITIAEGSETYYTTEEETEFVITTLPDYIGYAWNRIQKITISDMSPKTVSFNTNGGTPETIDPITEASFGAGIMLPDAPAKTDYIFDGWYTAATGGTLAGAAGATYYPADNCTLHAHWAEYAKSVNFVKSAEWGGYNWDTRFNDVQDSLDLYHYTMSPLGNTQWDNQGEESYDAGLKSENGDREFSFWVPAGKQVTIQLGTWQGGDGTAELDANGTKIADLEAKTANGPYTTTEDTKFVIKIVNPYWSLIQKITIDDAPLSEITIDENAEDNTVLTQNLNKTVDATVIRALTPGMFNTFCLPFDLSADQIANSDLAGSEIVRLTDADFDGASLSITFDYVDEISAGVPYLIIPAQATTEMVFTGVKITEDEGLTDVVPGIEFVATLVPTQLTPGDKDLLFVTSGNAVKSPKAGEISKMKGLRAYFHITSAQISVAMRSAGISIGRRLPTVVTELDEVTDTMLNGKMIINQHLYIRHNGHMYGVEGHRRK
ncbi:MAG: InlB B-repeat-containing protein [Paludibacteraceae bacterium]|nr:InlB B-repeat-containing protein [Paludibacteraceae bacterium]